VLNHISYDSFGQVTSETNPNIDFRYGYTGRERDEETGLDYNRTRYYDSVVGRFISEDTIGFKGGDTNLYRYVHNNPINLTDPYGTFDLWKSATGFVRDRANDVNKIANNVVNDVGKFANTVVNGGKNALAKVGDTSDGATRQAATLIQQWIKLFLEGKR
jgi:RHS repeat-associated protein